MERDDSPTKSMVLVITEIYSHDNDDVTDGSCDQTDAKVLNYHYIAFVFKSLHLCYLGYQLSYHKDVRWMVQRWCCHGYTT